MALEICENITKLTKEFQNQRLRLFSKLDINSKIEIYESKKSIFFKLKDNYKSQKNALLDYCSLILSIDDYVKSRSDESIKIKTFDSNKNSFMKKDKLLQYWPIIKQLKNEGMSFRNISIYLNRYHKLDVSYSLVFKKWNEIEINNGEKNGNN